MSTQPHLTPQWKEEVNRRVAAHKNRKNGLGSDAQEQSADGGASRAALAAARVAARYAKAPSYSQMQAEEARTAVRAAEIATQVALEAQAAAHSALAELHAASVEAPRGPAVIEQIGQAQRRSETEASGRASEGARRTEPAAAELPAGSAPAVPEPRYQQPFAVRWDADMPSRTPERRTPAPKPEPFKLAAEDWWNPAEIATELRDEPREVVTTEAGQANVLQFPRELVATRKMRPRLAEALTGVMTEAEGQLSIFEVDPRSIMTEVIVPGTMPEPASAAQPNPGWSGIRLDSHPVVERKAAAAQPRSIQHLAPFGLRMMAAVIDCALVLACFVVVGFIAAGSFHHPPSGKPAELLGMLSLVAIGLLYYGVFFSLGMSTPGMKYAGIGLCTFDDKSPTRAQLQRRLGAMALSLLPVGLGVVWAVFDEDHLAWHDRISQTYLRKC